MKAAGQDPAEAQAKVKAWERRKSDFVLNRTKRNPATSEHEREPAWGVPVGHDAIVADKEYMNSSGYKSKFHGLTGKEDVDNKICQAARKTTLDNSGAFYESMYLLDAETSEEIAAIDKTEEKVENGVV